MVVSELIKRSNEILKNAGIQSGILDTQLLLCKFLGVDRISLFIDKDREVENSDEFFRLVMRRAKHEPMQYILENCEFMSLDFFVRSGVLIPRPETELLVEKIIEFAKDRELTMLEIGTGSGCISVSCAHYCKNLKIDAVDVSDDALDVARINVKRHNAHNVNIAKADIFNDFPDNTYDIVVSNPPYIETGVIETLEPDVRSFEPLCALDGGCDGLMFYRTIAEKTKARGLIAFEIGYNQGDAVIQILENSGYKGIEVFCDLASLDRVITAKK